MMFGMNSWWSQGTHVCWNHHASVNMPWFILGRSTFSNPLYLPVLETCWDRHSISGRPTSQPNPLWLGSDGRKLALSFLFFWHLESASQLGNIWYAGSTWAASISQKNIKKKPLQYTANPTSSSLKFQPSKARVKGGLEVLDPIKPQVASRLPVGRG